MEVEVEEVSIEEPDFVEVVGDEEEFIDEIEEEAE